MSLLTHRVAFAERAVADSAEMRLTLTLNETQLETDASIVIDVYDLDNPVHPAGHLGWWKFPMGAASTLEAILRLLGDNVEATLEGQPPSELWRNPEPPRTRRLLVNAVVRSNTTNAILAIDRIPALPDEAALADFQSGFDRDWDRPRFAPASFVPDSGQTIHIVAPDIFLRDAVGELCLDLYRMLRQNRIAVRLHAENCDLAINDIVEPQNMLQEHVLPGDQILYFHSQFDPLLPSLLATPCIRKSVYFHGITDPTILRVFDPELSVVCTKGMAALPNLAGFDRIAANSRHSASLLARALGPEHGRGIRVIPPQLVASSTTVFDRSSPRHRALLTVSQMRPHKKLEDVLRLFAAYREIDKSAECWFVGRSPNRAYREYLSWVERKELGLPPGAVRWLGSVTSDELSERYATAAAYVSMSEDEGFCLPLFEAMRHGLPVLAYNIPAVAETLGGAGLRFSTKDFAHLARYLADLLDDETRRSTVVETQARCAEVLVRRMSGAEFFEFLAP